MQKAKLKNSGLIVGIFIALIFAGGRLCLGENSPEISAQPPQSGNTGPEITFEKAVHDFGEVAPGTTNVCEFKFTNTGDSVLKITNVSKTCACTPFTLSKKEYRPGESGTLKVKYRASKRPGLVSNHLYVFSNDKKNPKFELTIKAKIAPKVRQEPRKLNLSLKKENAGCPPIILKSIDNQPFSIKSFESTGSVITADFDPKAKATKFVLNPRVDIQRLRKILRGSVDIKLTHPGCHSISIPYEALPEFATNPSTLIVFKAEPQKPIKRELWILNNYGEKFEIESASSQNGFIKVEGMQKLGARYKLSLEIIPPPPTNKSRMFKDVFFVKIKTGEKLKINCHGVYRKGVVGHAPASNKQG